MLYNRYIAKKVVNVASYQKITKPCDVCGTPVTRSPSGFEGREKICCSKACWQKRMSGTFAKESNPNWGGGEQEYECEHCGKVVYRAPSQVKGAVYCNKECLVAAGRVTVFCNWCNSPKEMQRNQANKRPVHYCNRGCFAAWQASDKNPENQKVSAICTICEKEFTRSPSAFKGSRAKTCSRSCQGLYMRQIKGTEHPNWRGARIKIHCQHCGVEFTRRTRTQVFCGRDCADTANGIRIRGKNHPLWSGGTVKYYGDNWVEQRRLALRRDKYQCQRCKRHKGQDGVKRLNVHHKRKFRFFGYIPGENENYKEANDLSNLITLCVKCHGIIEPRNQYLKHKPQ